MREQKDESGERLDHEFEDSVSWSAEPDAGIVRGDHPVAQRVADAYRDLRGKIVADDWAGMITTYLEQHDAARIRGDGRVYWVPPQRVEAVRRLRAFLQEVGIDLILCELERRLAQLLSRARKSERVSSAQQLLLLLLGQLGSQGEKCEAEIVRAPPRRVKGITAADQYIPLLP